MARITYITPDQIDDEEMRGWLEKSIANGKPGPENQSIRAHSPLVMRSFTMTREWFAQESVLDKEIRELMRVYIATSLDCPY